MDDRDLKSFLPGIERACVLAWPALEAVRVGDWLWRYSGGGFSRSNSVATLGDPGCSTTTALDSIEARFRAHHARALVQVTDVSAPGDLRDVLLERGYTASRPNTTLALALDDMPVGTPPLQSGADFQILQHASEDWLRVCESVLTPDRKAMVRRVLAKLEGQALFCLGSQDQSAVATALVYVVGHVAIVECVAVLQSARKRGVGQNVMHNAAKVARDNGARVIALQALQDNKPAQQLYASLGYRQIGTYAYYEKAL